jgi:cytoskeletal protein RodZ
MYEDNVPVFRRILWIALWFVVIIVVLWVLIWLIFFRHHPAETPTGNNGHTTTQTNPTHQSAPATPTNTPPSSTGSSNPSSSASGSTGSPAPATSAPATAPSQLANTGAGDVFIPFAVATLTGSTIYYVRLVRKLRAEQLN